MKANAAQPASMRSTLLAAASLLLYLGVSVYVVYWVLQPVADVGPAQFAIYLCWTVGTLLVLAFSGRLTRDLHPRFRSASESFESRLAANLSAATGRPLAGVRH